MKARTAGTFCKITYDQVQGKHLERDLALLRRDSFDFSPFLQEPVFFACRKSKSHSFSPVKWHVCRILCQHSLRGDYTVAFADGSIKKIPYWNLRLFRGDTLSLTTSHANEDAPKGPESDTKDSQPLGKNDKLARSHLARIHETDRCLPLIVRKQLSPLFLAAKLPNLFVHVPQLNEWKLCRLSSYSLSTNLFTVVSSEGHYFIDVVVWNLRRPASTLSARINFLVSHRKGDIMRWDPFTDTPQKRGPRRESSWSTCSIWEAAERGDTNTVLGFISHGWATVNEAEPGSDGRRIPLVCASFYGHVDLVRELLLCGAFDIEGRASQCAGEGVKGTNKTYVEHRALLIRAMLSVSAANPYDGSRQDLDNLLPKRLYHCTKEGSAASECIICLDRPIDGIPVPCHHFACCSLCLEQIRLNEAGCPICRRTIKSIITLHATHAG